MSVIPEASFTNPEVDEIIGEDEIGGDIISHIIGDETRYSDSVEGILGLDIIDEILGI